jgi:hypothetical protein
MIVFSMNCSMLYCGDLEICIQGYFSHIVCCVGYLTVTLTEFMAEKQDENHALICLSFRMDQYLYETQPIRISSIYDSTPCDHSCRRCFQNSRCHFSVLLLSCGRCFQNSRYHFSVSLLSRGRCFQNSRYHFSISLLSCGRFFRIAGTIFVSYC